jgi:FMN phosphatase YigB (HAD superfamily)
MSKSTDKSKYKLLIFDLDGTLYNFKSGTFSKSKLQKIVLSNAKKFIESQLKLSPKQSGGILKSIISKYGEHISIGLEKDFNLSRSEYFNAVWNIKPIGIIAPNQKLRPFLMSLIKNKYKLVILSDAPNIWISNVLNFLNLKNIFKNDVYSGESNNRKDYGNAFKPLIKKLKYAPKDCVVIGDQEKTDIVPAKEMGATTVFISKTRKSTFADYNFRSIFGLKKVLNL